MTIACRYAYLILFLSLLFTIVSCSSGSSDDDTALRPGPVDSIVTNRGDGTASVGWEYTGDQAVGFTVEVTPTAGTVTLNGRTAVIEGLTNGTTYTIGVRTRSNGLLSTPVSESLTPAAIDSAGYAALTVGNDPSLSGIFDPSFYRDDSGTVWMTYSGVDYYQSGGNLVQDVSTRLARSDDNGATFTLVTTLGTADTATVTDTSGSLGCTNNTCDGRWVYEVPFIIDDRADPDSARRFKIYAHKYFLLPGASPATVYFLGSMVRWTAPTPDSAWSAETTVLRWDLSPPEIAGGINLNDLAPALAACIVFSEGGASVGTIANSNVTEFVFSCPYLDSGSGNIVQKIVQLRTRDHDQQFTYTGTPITFNDAPGGVDYYSAPSLLPRIDSSPVLLVTPVVNGLYAGCEVFSYTDFTSATLTSSGGDHVSLVNVPALNGNFGGACAWDRDLNDIGISLNNFDINSSPPFSILATGYPL